MPWRWVGIRLLLRWKGPVTKRDDRPFTIGTHHFDRRKCDYCGRYIGINVRAQHMRAKHYEKPEPPVKSPV